MTQNEKFTSIVIVLSLGFIVWVNLNKRDINKLISFILAWSFPGLGHIYSGKFMKGLFFFAVLFSIYLFGLWLTNFRMVGYDDNPYYYVGQFGSGIMVLIGSSISFEKAFPRDGFPLSFFDPGLLYVCVAGILNYVVALSMLKEDKAAEPLKQDAQNANVSNPTPQ